MEMRGWIMRLARVVLIAVAAWIAFQLLEPEGLAWTVPVAMGAVALLWIGWRVVVVQRQRVADAQADRWAEALMDPSRRPSAIAEIRTQLTKKQHAQDRARSSLVLAELLEADGDPNEARKVLDAVALVDLPDRIAAMIVHARAVAAISAGDAASANEVLDQIPGPCGDRSVDLRVRLLRGVIAAETGEGERALEIADQARKEAVDDGDLKMEARVLKAIALDALGDRADAIKVMRALGDDMLGVLIVLGLPRVKKLAQEALDAD